MLKLSVELPAVCGNIVWGQRVSWFPHVCCKTPTQLVQLLSGVWHCSELWHLHHANWRVCISMWTSLLVCRTRLCFQLHTHTHTHTLVCAAVSEWPCVLCFGLWLFGGQCWCGLCLREWIYHLLPYGDLHQLSWLFHSRREKFLSSFYLFCLFAGNFDSFGERLNMRHTVNDHVVLLPDNDHIVIHNKKLLLLTFLNL